MPNALATELNERLEQQHPEVLASLSALGREFFFPKGILTQSAEAKQKAKRFNATIGIATEGGKAMHLSSVMSRFSDLEPNDVLPYASSMGRPDLRAKWKEMMAGKNPALAGKTLSTPVVTSGITHGLSTAADLFCDPGDLLILPDMLWGNYRMIFSVRRGAKIETCPFFSAEGGFDTAAFSAKLDASVAAGAKKIVLILNFPNNPSGYSPTDAEAETITAAILKTAEAGTRVVAICDDAYFGLFYDDAVATQSIFTRLCDLHEKVLAIKLDGATKEDYVWGFRVGFMTYGVKGGNGEIYDALERKSGGCIRGTISNCSNLSQMVMLKAMSDPAYAAQRAGKVAVLRGRAEKVMEVLKDERFAEVWEPYPFNSGYFMCLKMKDIDAEAFRVKLLDEHGIGTISTSKTDIRVAFSCVEEGNVEELFVTMYECAKAMKGVEAAN